MYTARIRTALLFYRYYCIVPTLLWLPGMWLYHTDGLMLPLLLMKAALNGLIWYFITLVGTERLYYYYNLHVSRRFLFLAWFISDLLLFSISLWLTKIM